MILRTKFECEEINNEKIFISVDSEVLNGIIRANSTAAYIVDCLSEEISMNDLKNKVIHKYGVDEEIAKKAVEYVVNQLNNIHLLVY